MILSFLDYWEHVPLLSSKLAFQSWFTIAELETVRQLWMKALTVHSTDDQTGTRQVTVSGRLHCESGPAIEFSNGSKHWFLDNKVHRADGPAIEQFDGDFFWVVEGKNHREDGPAIVYSDGSKEWYLHGKRHRVDGPAVEYSDGTRRWYLDDILVEH